MQHDEINWQSAFRSVSAITGLPLRFERCKWFGACYMSGEPHSRWDKTVVYQVKDGIRILEQGGENLTLLRWLMKHGGCCSWAEAFARIRSGCGGYVPEVEARTWVEPILMFVPSGDVVVRNGECNLFRFLADRFGRDEVEQVWQKYRVGSKVLRSGEVATVFWYFDSEGRCCHDKVMLYGENGHRNKEYGGTRKYKVSDGFRGKTYFGSHLLEGSNDENKVVIAESEKSALIMSLADSSRIYLATGGGSMLREVGKNWKIYPDFDNVGLSWCDRYPTQCVKWWEKYEGVEKGMDIADIILRNI